MFIIVLRCFFGLLCCVCRLRFIAFCVYFTCLNVIVRCLNVCRLYSVFFFFVYLFEILLVCILCYLAWSLLLCVLLVFIDLVVCCSSFLFSFFECYLSFLNVFVLSLMLCVMRFVTFFLLFMFVLFADFLMVFLSFLLLYCSFPFTVYMFYCYVNCVMILYF